MADSTITLRGITKSYGSKPVLTQLDVTLHPGELVALLGPSGCGKSTTLKILAGLERPDAGSVLVGDRDITSLPTRKRNMGIVFQAYSLFPHMTASENIAYGLRIRRVSRAERTRRAAELLELVGLADHGAKYPAQLSGGQQQRVALARALSLEPEVLLLDEPLSALDAQVRGQLRDEIRRLQLAQGITTLLVTHDQEEALVMADRVGVMNAGRIVQLSSPEELYHHPTSAFVSEFVGVTNRIPGRLAHGGITVLGQECSITNTEEIHQSSGMAVALIRPEDLDIEPREGASAGASSSSASAHSSATALRSGAPGSGVATVVGKQLRGTFTAVQVADPTLPEPVRVDMPTRRAQGINLGDAVRLTVNRRDVVVDTLRAAEMTNLEVLGNRGIRGARDSRAGIDTLMEV